jgi:hypothetical protein
VNLGNFGFKDENNPLALIVKFIQQCIRKVVSNIGKQKRMFLLKPSLVWTGQPLGEQ